MSILISLKISLYKCTDDQSTSDLCTFETSNIGSLMFGPPSEVIPALLGSNKENAHGSSKGSSPETSHIKKTLPEGEEGYGPRQLYTFP